MSDKVSAREVIINALAPDVSNYSARHAQRIKEVLGPWHAKYADAILDALKANGYAVVELPAPEARGVTEQSEWPVPITCTLTGGLRTGSRGGAVFIRRSDGRIALDGIPTPLPTVDDARRTAAALLAAAAERDSEER